jgi:hypothetical protein
MYRLILTAVAALGITATASAQNQFPAQPYGGGQYYPPPSSFMPNIYNPANQPLSPYLNFFRNNPAVNYYYGVRPGTSGGFGFGALGAPFTAPGGNRPLFFPQLANAPDPLQSYDAQAQPGDVLPPAGHPVVFNNTLGYFPSPFGARGTGATQRTGLSNVGTSGARPTGR